MQEGKSRRTLRGVFKPALRQPVPIKTSPEPSSHHHPQRGPPDLPAGEDQHLLRARTLGEGGKGGRTQANPPRFRSVWINVVQAPTPQLRDLRPLFPAERGCLAPLSPITHCCCTRAGYPRLQQRWRVHGKEIAALWLKNPQESFFSTPYKGKLSEPAPHHPHSSPDTAPGADTGVLDANFRVWEVGQAKTFPLTAAGRGACQELSRMSAWREMQQPVPGRGAREAADAATTSVEVSDVGMAAKSSRGKK